MAATAYPPAHIPTAMSAIEEAVSSVSQEDGITRIVTECLILKELANECACMCGRDITAPEMERATVAATEAASQIREMFRGLSPHDKLRRIMTIHEDLGRTTAGNVFQRTVSHEHRPR